MDHSPEPALSALPHTHLCIGVTGHRLERLGDDRLPDLVQMIQQTLTTLVTAAEPYAPSMRLITALADGGDSLVANAASAMGWTLQAVLPFPSTVYRYDFTRPDTQANYDRLLALSQSVFELPGLSTPTDAAALAYERAGQVMLGQCDILLAIWDNEPVLGRGGTAQIVAEAVMCDIPVIHIDPAVTQPAVLLWDGLTEHDLGQQTVDTVPRGGLDQLPSLMHFMLALPGGAREQSMIKQLEGGRKPRRNWALAYQLLLAVLGVRPLRRADFQRPSAVNAEAVLGKICERVATRTGDFGELLRTVLVPRFARADLAANALARIFRSSYVANFMLAALAVLLTLLSLALPAHIKPVIATLELITIAMVLLLTTMGNRRGWHQRWLDNRQLAERLRCLAIAAQVGELNVDAGNSWVDWSVRATARQLGIPHVCVDPVYLADVRDGLRDLIDSEVAYLNADAHQMHRLEHRLHLLGTSLFGLTALVCLGSLLFEAAMSMSIASGLERYAHRMLLAVTMASAGLPALGAAIYGIRMQGEFAGVAARAEGLAHHLGTLRHVIDSDALSFDTLKRRILHLTDLLTVDLTQWRQTYHARPLSLPG